ncbi:MAG: substrate-binding domain-containing protein [Candidatus Hydrogenedentes bacterium]|nr:substrate-binding domain-containing protein [Candidatus Hydrogenedentota bacterium]
MKRFGFGVLAVAMCVAMLGCGQQSTPTNGPTEGAGGQTPAAGAQKKLVIGFSQCNSAEPYRTAQNNIFQSKIKEYGDKYELVIHDAQQDNSRQRAQIETLITQKVDLLIVAPNEATPLTPVVKKAHDAGIKVICLERDLAEPVYDVFVGADNVVIGEMAGQYVKEYCEGKGLQNPVIVEMKGYLGTKPQEERHNGARKSIDTIAGVKVIEEVANWLQDEAKKRMQTILQANPKIDVVYAHNDPMAIGCYLAAQEAGREKEMIFVGVDGLGGEAGGIKKVMDGVLACTFIYPPCASEALDVAIKMLNGEPVEPRLILQPTKVTPENAKELYEKATVAAP